VQIAPNKRNNLMSLGIDSVWALTGYAPNVGRTRS
jgi:hypothetical protein